MNDQKNRFYTYGLAFAIGLVAVAIKWLMPDMEWVDVMSQIGIFVGLATTLLALVKSNPTKYAVTPVDALETPDN